MSYLYRLIVLCFIITFSSLLVWKGHWAAGVIVLLIMGGTFQFDIQQTNNKEDDRHDS